MSEIDLRNARTITLPGVDASPSAGASADPATPGNLAGCVLDGAFRLVRKLGEGGMGAVYLAEDVTLRTLSAVKVQPLGNPDAIARFEAEARMSAQFRETRSVVAAVRQGRDAALGVAYYVMDVALFSRSDAERLARSIGLAGLPEGLGEFPRTLSLEDVCGGLRALPSRAVLAIARRLARAIFLLHGASPRILHCDIKPSNALFFPDGSLRLCDLGVARGGDLAPGDLRQGGTAGYAAPEQIKCEELTEAVDYYALGAALYRLLAGAPPPSPGFVTLPPDVPRVRAWRGLVGGLLAADPNVRIHTPEGLDRSLRATARKLAWSAPRVALLLLALGVVLAAGVRHGLRMRARADQHEALERKMEADDRALSAYLEQLNRENEAESIQRAKDFTENQKKIAEQQAYVEAQRIRRKEIDERNAVAEAEARAISAKIEEARLAMGKTIKFRSFTVTTNGFDDQGRPQTFITFKNDEDAAVDHPELQD